MTIRPVIDGDLWLWAEMRGELWPGSIETLRDEIEAYFTGHSVDIVEAFMAEDAGGTVVGFMELNIRNFAEGSRSPRLPYVEAWYVKPEYRGQGYGRAMMQRAEQWAREKGFQELASDTEFDNEVSIAAHKHLGFKETERIVCFLKKLD